MTTGRKHLSADERKVFINSTFALSPEWTDILRVCRDNGYSSVQAIKDSMVKFAEEKGLELTFPAK